MSGEDWIAEYERAVADLPPPVPMAQWTVEDARAHAEAAFHEAPAALERDRLYSHARRQARAAKSEKRLATIKEKEPEAGAMIEGDLDWMRRHVAGFAGWPFRLQIEHWYRVTTRDNSVEVEKGTRRKGEIQTARGRKSSQPELRAAAFVLMDWRKAMGRPVTVALYGSSSDDHGDDPHAPSAAVAWLAEELAALDCRLAQASRGGLGDYERLAFREAVAWQDATMSGARP